MVNSLDRRSIKKLFGSNYQERKEIGKQREQTNYNETVITNISFLITLNDILTAILE